MNTPRVSFVVVTHARPKWLWGAIESIRRQTIDSREIVVVVNGSDPETQELLRPLGPEVRTAVLNDNCGVGGGRNAGIDIARGDILFFLDDDAELPERDAVGRVLKHYDNDLDLGAVGLLVIDAVTGEIDRRCIPFRNKRLPREARPACYFAGGACAIHRRVFDRVGLYDEGLFYGGEELDLSYRALDAGFHILFDPSVPVMHHRAEGLALSAGPYYHARNRPWIALRHLPLRCYLTHTIAWWAWSLARSLRAGAPAYALRGMHDCVAGIPGIWRARRPISRQTWQTLVSNGGRLWY